MKENTKKIIPWILFLIITSGLLTWIFLSKRVTEEEIATYDNTVAEGQLHYANREYSTSMEKYYEATKLIPDRIGAYEGIIEILLDKNRGTDAEEIINETAKDVSAKNLAILNVLIGDFYYTKGEYTDSLKAYEQATQSDGNNQNANIGYAKSLLQAGDISKATKTLENNVYEGDLLSESQLILTCIYSLEDVEKAKEIILNNEATETWSIYYEEMSQTLNDLTEDTKYNATKLARVYINNGYPYLAIQILEVEKENIGEYVEGLYFLGRAYYEYGENTKAIQTLEDASLVGGLEIEIFWTEARAYLKTQDLDNSLKMYERTVAYSGEEIDQNLAKEYLELLVENNQQLKAEEAIKKFLNYSDEIWVHILALETYSDIEELEKVDFYIEALGEMELTTEQSQEHLYWKARREIEKDTLVKAKETLIALLALDKYNSKYYYLLGKLEFAEGQTENAITALERCLEYDLKYEITEEATKLLSRIE